MKRRAVSRRTAKSARVVRRAAPARKKSKFRVNSTPKKKFSDRFQKFYYLHREDLNKFRRSLYRAHKTRGVCVKCSAKRLKTSVFCPKHLKRSRIANSRR